MKWINVDLEDAIKLIPQIIYYVMHDEDPTVETFMRLHNLPMHDVVEEAVFVAESLKLVKRRPNCGMLWQDNEDGEILMDFDITFKGMWYYWIHR